MAESATPNSSDNFSGSSSISHGTSMSSAAVQALGSRPRIIQRRPTKQATYELANHAKAYLEAGQLTSGFDFLSSLLAAGTSISTPARPYIGLLAPPAYIAFASSLVVDPRFTTQARRSSDIKGSDAALRYLQCVHATIDGPAYSNIRAAFQIQEERTRRRAPGHRSAASSLSPGHGGDVERITGEDAITRGLWYIAEDFWHIVGWAFNCSVAYTNRWERWRLWLEIMLGFLEADWNFCDKQSKSYEANREKILQESLIWRYIVGDTGSVNRGARRRMVKAIFATATAESRRDYPEVWEKETAELKRKRDEDQPTGETENYDTDEEMQDVTAFDISPHNSHPSGVKSVHDASEALGGADAIDLRQRFVALLWQVAYALPTLFTTWSDFFDNVLESMIHLPTMTFKVVLSTLKLSPRVQIAFQMNLLLPLVSHKLPDYLASNPVQEHFESQLLALKGTTQSFASNAKISIILEQMVLYMMDQDALIPTEALREALEFGVRARQGVQGTARGIKGNAHEEQNAKELMEASSERLLSLFELLEIGAGKPPQPCPKRGSNVSSIALSSFTSTSSLSPPPDSDGDSGGVTAD